jgi:hypothetical protein
MDFISGQKCLNTAAAGGITAKGLSADYSTKLHFRTFSSLRKQCCLVSLRARKALKYNSGSLKGSSVGILARYEKCKNIFIETSTFLSAY